MLKHEFTDLTDLIVDDEVVWDKIHQFYMDSPSNKFDFCNHLMIEFKDWVWKNLDNLLLTNKKQLFYHFVIYELDYYEEKL